MRPSKVVYDRAVFRHRPHVKPGDFRLGQDPGGRRPGCTGPASRPALSDGAAAVTLEACKAAKARGVTICCDLNYRKNLWSREKAGQVMGELVPYVDVLIANEEDSADVFGIHADAHRHQQRQAGAWRATSPSPSQLVERFGCEKVAITLRECLSASDNNWSGMLYDGASPARSPSPRSTRSASWTAWAAATASAPA